MNFTPQSVACFWLGWFAYCIAMSFISGWWMLSKKFKSREPALGNRWFFVSGSVARWNWLPMQYHATFFLTLSDSGFRLSVFLPVRLMHPPLYFPWTSVSQVSTEPFLFLFRQTIIEITADEKINSSIKIRLRGKAGNAFLQQYKPISNASSAPNIASKTT